MINKIIERMGYEELKGFILSLAKRDKLLYNAILGLDGGLNIQDYKFRLAKAIGDPVMWSSYNDDYESISNSKILAILAEVEAIAKEGRSYKRIIELMAWLLDILSEGYLSSIDGLISESIIASIEILALIAKGDSSYCPAILDILLSHYDDYEYNLEDEIKASIRGIILSMDMDQAFSILISDELLEYFDIIEDVIKNSEYEELLYRI